MNIPLVDTTFSSAFLITKHFLMITVRYFIIDYMVFPSFAGLRSILLHHRTISVFPTGPTTAVPTVWSGGTTQPVLQPRSVCVLSYMYQYNGESRIVSVFPTGPTTAVPTVWSVGTAQPVLQPRSVCILNKPLTLYLLTNAVIRLIKYIHDSRVHKFDPD